jgi:hypothetical protein
MVVRAIHAGRESRSQRIWLYAPASRQQQVRRSRTPVGQDRRADWSARPIYADRRRLRAAAGSRPLARSSRSTTSASCEAMAPSSAYARPTARMLRPSLTRSSSATASSKRSQRSSGPRRPLPGCSSNGGFAPPRAAGHSNPSLYAASQAWERCAAAAARPASRALKPASGGARTWSRSDGQKLGVGHTS